MSPLKRELAFDVLQTVQICTAKFFEIIPHDDNALMLYADL